MKISARDRLKGKVVDVVKGATTAHIRSRNEQRRAVCRLEYSGPDHRSSLILPPHPGRGGR